MEGEIELLKAEYEQERMRDKELQRQTEYHAEQMSETIKNLNGIFKTMQTDVDAGRAADTLAKCRRLEKQVAELTEKCSAMSQVKQRLAEELTRSASHTVTLEALQTDLSRMKIELQRRDESIGELMEREALRNAEIEKLQRMAALRNDSEEALELAEPPSSVLCIKCKRGLDDLSNLRAAIIGAGQNNERVQCQNFRVLLPNIRGRRPHRSIEWIRHRMRAILAAKTRESLTLHPIRADIPRFPEFVYAWFEPDAEGIRPAKDLHSAVLQADEDRWGFYYGVKVLAQDDAEAKIFWSLLDEAHGEDGLTFVCHCLSMVMSLGRADLWTQFGDAFDHCSHSSLRHVPPTAVPAVIWLDLRTAREAVRRILVRALKPQLQEILEAIEGMYAITISRFVSSRAVD